MTPPVAAGILSFTQLDPSQHHAYNAWHRYVHMPEEFLVDGVVAAQRLVAQPDLLARRTGSDPALQAAQYFGYYFIAAPIHEAFREMEHLGTVRRTGGGDLADRRSPSEFGRKGPSATFELAGVYSAPGVVTAPAVMPFRPHRGVFVTVDRASAGARPDELAESHLQIDATRVPTVMGLPGVAGCWSFQSADLMKIPNNKPAQEGRSIRVYWLDGDPIPFLDALVELGSVSNYGLHSTVFSGAFRVIEPDSAFDWFDA